MSKLPRQRRPLIEALEPRLLFSATADIAVFDDGHSEVLHLAQAAEEVDLVSIYMPSAEFASADSAVNPDSNTLASDHSLLPEQAANHSSLITTLVFVDTSVSDYETLINDLRTQNTAGEIEIIYLDAEQDGVAQITQALNRYTNLDALHIVSHGSAGSIALGNSLLSINNVSHYEQNLTAWRGALSAGADILVYGCDVAANSAGQQLLAQIAAFTAADVAASNDATGHQSLQGDWELEYALGDIESTGLISAAAQEQWVNVMATSHWINIQGGTTAQSVSSASGVGQSFLYDSPGATYTVNQISVQLRLESGAANQDITFQLLDGGWNDASPLATQTINSNQLDSSFGWQTFNFGDVTLNDNQTYIVKITTNNADGKVSVAYKNDAWNGSEMIVNGTGNSSNDLNFLLSYNNGSNQTPVNTVPGAQTTNQNTPLIFSSLYGNQIQVADADAFPNDVEITLSSGQGSFSLAQTTGLTFTNGDGTSDFNMVFRGSVSEVNSALATITYTPVTNFVGGDTFSITTKDLGLGGGLQDQDNISITINNLNDAPTVTITPTDYYADEQIAMDLHGTGIVVNDSDGDPLTVTLTGAGSNSNLAATVGTTNVVIVSGLNTNTLVLSGTAAQLNNLFAGNGGSTLTYRLSGDTPVATRLLTISASDGSLSGNDTATINITALNDEPENDVPGAQATDEDTALVFSSGFGNRIQVGDLDADSSDLEVTLLVTNGTLTLGGVANLAFTTGDGTADGTMVFRGSQANINTALATLTFDPTANYNGAAVLTITTSDLGNTGSGGTLTDTDNINITVNPLNDPIALANTIPDQIATEGVLFSFAFAANTFSNPDSGGLTYTATLANGDPLPPWLTFNDGTRTFSGTADDGNVGTINIKVTADDGSGSTAEDTFALQVNNVNDLPFVHSPVPNQNATEDVAFSYTFPANTFGDGDLDASFSYSAQLSGGGLLPGWLTFDDATRTFSGTPDNGDVGTISIELVADDGTGATVSDTFDVIVAGANDAPTVAFAIANQTATENALFNFTFAINTFNDQDAGDSLTYTAQLSGGGALPGWLSFDDATRTFSGTPSNGDVGTLSIEVTATDGATASVADVFDLVIQNVGSSNVVYETSGGATDTQTLTAGVPFYQSFSHNSGSGTYTIDTLVLQLLKDPVAATQNITVTLISGAYNGAIIKASAMSSDDLNTTLSWEAFDFSNEVLVDNQLYFIKIETDNNDGLVRAGIHNTDVYANGSFHSSTGVADLARDVAFQVSSGVNSNPAIANPIANQNATEDAAFNFQFAADVFADVDPGDTLTYSATMADGSPLPAWLFFNDLNRTFSGTPGNGDVGTISIRVTADDGNGGTPATDTFDLTIANSNDAPTVASPIANQTATEDQAFNFTFAANTFADPDAGNTLTYTAQLAGGGPLPAWLIFDDATRTFSGTPTNGDVGTIAIDVIANDGNLGTVTDTFNIQVGNTNDAPTVANVITNQNATEDAAFTFQFAANTFADVDAGATLTYTAQLAGGGPLPVWLIFDDATRTFSGTPTNGDVGTISIDVIANDGNSGTVSETFDIVVGNTNDAPTVANVITNQNATENASFNFQFAANTFNDVDAGATLTYTAQLAGGGPLPVWLIFDDATRTFSGTPTNGDVGTISIEVIADDGNLGTVTETFDIVVANANDAPTIANVIANQNATEEAPFNFQFAANTFNDVDAGATLTYTAQLAGGGLLPAWLSFDPVTRTFSGTPTNGDVGTISIDVIADDGNLGTVTETFDIVVGNSNDAPTIANAIPDRNATENSLFNFQFAANTFADVDAGDTLTYTAQLAGGGAIPAWLSFDPVTRTFSGTPTNGDIGTISIDVTADDGNGGTVTDTFDLVVSAGVNNLPTVANTIPNQNATEDALFNFQFAANTFNDVDAGTTLTYTAQLAGGASLPAWLSFDSATRTFSGLPLNAQVGTISVEVTADDGNGGTVAETFDIVVANANDAPTIANTIPNQNATENASFNFQFALNTFADVDVGDTLRYTAQLAGGGTIPAWLSFDPATRTFSGTPTNGDVGTIAIDVIANDGNLGTVTETFDIVVANANDAPTIANTIPNQNATEDALFNFQFAANTFNDVDAGATLTYTAQLAGGGLLPAWLSFDPVTRTFSGTPTNGDVGTISIDVIADDGNLGTVTETFDIVVGNTNDAPTIANAIPDRNATENSLFNFQFAANTFADVDAGDTLTYTAQLAGGGTIPAWLSFDPVTRTFSGTPANGDIGTISIDVTADDGNGGTVTDTFDLVVSAGVNNLPTVANTIPNQNATEDALFNFQFAANTFNDVDAGTTLTYTAQLAGGASLPAWLSFDSATRTFSGTPGNDDVSNLLIQVRASDGLASVTTQFQLTVVAVNSAPVATALDAINNLEDDPADSINLFAVFSDEESAANQLVYSVVANSNPGLFSAISFDSQTGLMHFSYAANQFGSADLIIRAQDGQGAMVETPLRINIAAVNDTPTATPLSDLRVTAGSAPQSMDLRAVFTDIEDGRLLSYQVIENTNPAVAPELQLDSVTGQMNLIIAAETSGETSITLRAMDSEGAWVESSFILTVTAKVTPPDPVDPVDPPVVQPPDISVPPTTTPETGDGGGLVPPVVQPPIVQPPTAQTPDTSEPLAPTDPDAGSLTPPDNTAVQVAGDTTDPFNQNPDDKKSAQDYQRASELASKGMTSVTSLTASPALASLIAPENGFAPWEVADFDSEVRRIRAQMDDALEAEQDRKAVIAGLTFSLTTGLLIWSLRASSLLLTLMSMLPLWRGLDPLPILDEVNKRKKELEQQRKDRKHEDKNAKEVGYLFDHAQGKGSGQ